MHLDTNDIGTPQNIHPFLLPVPQVSALPLQMQAMPMHEAIKQLEAMPIQEANSMLMEDESIKV